MRSAQAAGRAPGAVLALLALLALLLALGVALAATLRGGPVGAPPDPAPQRSPPAAAAADLLAEAPALARPNASQGLATDDGAARTAVEIPPAPAVESPPAALSGHVVDRTGAPVGHLVVRAVCMQDTDNPQEVRADADGHFAFATLRPGHYRVHVDGDRTPRGILATEASSKRTQLASAAQVDLGSLVVERAAGLWGQVQTATGAPVPMAKIRINGRGARMSQDVFSDALGQFHCDGLLAGRYRIELDLAAAPAELRALSLPRTSFFDLGAAAQIVLDPLVCGGGTATVQGTVLDQDGKPVANLPVRCWDAGAADSRDAFDADCRLLSINTDADGHFALTQLPGGPIGLDVGYGAFKVSAAYGESTLAKAGPSLRIDLANGELRELGFLSVQRSRPYRIRGHVVLAPGYATEHDLTVARLEVVVDTGARPAARIPVAADGTFTWWCHTPHAPVTVTVHWLDTFGSGRQVLQPCPDATDELTLPFPN